jgi:hypothetical protein
VILSAIIGSVRKPGRFFGRGGVIKIDSYFYLILERVIIRAAYVNYISFQSYSRQLPVITGFLAQSPIRGYHCFKVELAAKNIGGGKINIKFRLDSRKGDGISDIKELISPQLVIDVFLRMLGSADYFV